jgi:FAD/FMN-containing dehydrogenase
MSISGVDVVTSDGALVHATEHMNSELLWAARGAGPGFPGVVTRFHLRCHPLPRSIRLSQYTYPITVADDLFRWSVGLQAILPPEIELFIVAMGPRRDGAVRALPPVLAVTGIALCETDQEARSGLSLLDTFPSLHRAISSHAFQSMALDGLYSVGDGGTAKGYRWAVDNMWTDADASELVQGVSEMIRDLPTHASHVHWYLWNPQEIEPAALSITGRVYISAFSGWTQPSDDARYVNWGRDHIKRLERFSNGIQLADENLIGRGDARFMSTRNLERLEEIRRTWDPAGIVHGYLIGTP